MKQSGGELLLRCHRAFVAGLTFLGLGRTAPEEVHRAVRAGVTVLPGLKTTVLSWLVFLRADSLAKRPRADAMLRVFDAAAMRKTAHPFLRRASTAPSSGTVTQ